MNKKYFIVILILGIPFVELFAQYDNVWVFGNNAGIDFNTYPPQAMETKIESTEGCASVCDAQGNLLFYTNGSTVWNRNHSVMPNGENLPLGPAGIVSSSSQGTLIASVPDDPDKYYIFSLGSIEYSYFGKLYYSIVDMSLANGQGDVPEGQKGILLDSLLTEHMTAVIGDDCNIWLVVQSRTKEEIKSYRIDHKGIHSTPVISERVKGDGGVSGGIGCMDVSPNRKKIAVAQGNLVVYNFDALTGKLDRSFVLDDFPVGISPGGYYGVAFSHDNSKIYANDVPFFYQFDLSLGSETEIKQSKTRLSDTRLHNATIKRGPDGKMYASTMSVIHHPDLAGLNCQFEDRGFQLAPGTISSWGLPNVNAVFHYEQRHSITTDTFNCVDSVMISPQLTQLSDYTWNDGSTSLSKKVTESGLYWVKYYDLSSGCIRYTDSFYLDIKRNNANYSSHTLEGMCTQDTFVLNPASLSGSSYQWENGDTVPERWVNQPGTYWIHYRIDSLCAINTDSFKVSYPSEPFKVSFAADSFVCLHASFQLQNTSHENFRDFYWTMGDGSTSEEHSPYYQYADTGTFMIQLTGKINDRCYDTVYKPVTIDPRLPAFFSLSKDKICIGETIIANTKNNITLSGISWNWGDGVLQNKLSGETGYQHAYDIAGSFSVQLTASFRACPDTGHVDTVYVSELPKVDLGPKENLCLNSQPVILTNYGSYRNPDHLYLWSTGDTTPTLKITNPGIYQLSITDKHSGCMASERIVIDKDCFTDIPNAFTPNGDGVNDYFFPRQLLSKSISSFDFKIFNRWGQLVFRTNLTDGRGWDGRFNGKEQPDGVYIYIMEVRFNNDQQERYEGNVSLIR